MSFDKKIRDKLVNHIPKYDERAWSNFQKLLPKPWYMKLLSNSTGWILGGICTTALLITLYSNYTTKEKLYGEISTLNEEIQNQASLENTKIVSIPDTVFVLQEVIKYIDRTKPSKAETLAYQNGLMKGEKEAEKTIALLQKQLSELRTNSVAAAYTAVFENVNSSKLLNDNHKTELTKLKEDNIIYHEEKKVAGADALNNDSSGLNEKAHPLNQIVATEVSEEQIYLTKDSLKHLSQNIEVALLEEENTKSAKGLKKKIIWPRMRFGLSTDYLGFSNLVTGPTAEVFLTDKLSVNASGLFSGQIETKHSFAKDFNKNTGKLFNEEFEKYIGQKQEQIEDISIKTSFIKLPLFLNYYINTWSRFNFIISAGTKLDLSVYQDVGYNSGPLDQQVRSRFETKTEPKVFNNLFYGMGLQYKYKNFVGQLTPYFDFTFRKADYFTPQKNFGLNAKVKFEFGN